MVGGRSVDHGSWRTAIGRLSDRVQLHPRPTIAIHGPATEGAWVVSVDGSVTAADVHIDDRSVFTAVSIYTPWEMAANRGYADASAHRILSDLSALVGSANHRLVVAGDWNILRGYGEYGNTYWKARYDTVFERAEALGLRCVGPAAPNGRQAQPWPEELPIDSPLCPDVSPQSAVASYCHTAARLRVRIGVLGRCGRRSCGQRGRRLGTERPLPDRCRHRGLRRDGNRVFHDARPPCRSVRRLACTAPMFGTAVRSRSTGAGTASAVRARGVRDAARHGATRPAVHPE